MNNLSENSYWIALAHLPRWRTFSINNLIVRIFKEKEITLQDFFGMDVLTCKRANLNSKEANDLHTAKLELPNYSFLSEELTNQGFNILPINSTEKYSKALKQI